MADDKKKDYNYDALLAPVERGNKVDEETAKRTEEAGVTHPAFVDYEEAQENYQSRPDVETLEQRRAREAGTSFSDAAFRRQAGENSPGVTTSEDVAAEPADEKKSK